ncbi:HNH endonuclease signature motif containing protein, partial [Microbispora sp. NPDC046933]|uniref:HNH endonuclease signature motif containing protein n=1 Tax=Microbispora sp. NPDC046933 TaxID=3155618 RepID=UPI0033C58C91
GGGLEGEFYLPREAAARLRALLDAYAKPKAEGDDRSLQVRQADALIALLEQKIATELLVLVNAESLPADPEDATPTDSTHTDDTSDTDTSAPHDPRDTGDCDPRDTGSADDPGDAGAEAGAGAAVDAAAESAGLAATGLCGEEAGGCGAGQQRAGGHGPRDAVSTASVEGGDLARVKGEDCARAEGQNRAPAMGDDGAFAEVEDSVAGEAEGAGPGCPAQTADEFSGGDGARPQAALPHAVQPDPPPEDAAVRHTHAGHRPAGDCRHAQDTPGNHGDVRCGQSPPRTPPGTPQGVSRGWPPKSPLGTAQGASPGSVAGTAAGTAREALLGLAGALPGALLGTAPGLLLATGQVLPVSGVHRLARTSALVRLVMDADGQVLDMGRKVRLATPAQRRAIFARYATCWIDGCPLPATMCQIDHADNWSSGGLTDLKLLGPACQFHNRDRYRHPDRYTRRKEGTDRWAFTYHRPPGARRLRE